MSMADQDHLKVFAGRAGLALAQAMCDRLDLPLGQGRTDLFPDGELLVKVDEDVRGRDCFVVQSTSDPVNANLMELLIYIDCLRRASAKRITAVIPYFGYARQDRKDEGRVPITAKLVANLITAAGADRVLCLDLHAAQIRGSLISRCTTSRRRPCSLSTSMKSATCWVILSLFRLTLAM